jgi:hypothetical protein
MFQADFFEMFKEVQRQEEIGPFHSDDAEIGKEIFFFFAGDILPLIRSNESVYEAAKMFALEYADEYFTTLRLLESVKGNQDRLTALRNEIQELIREAMSMGLASNSVNLTKPSDFVKVVNVDKLPADIKQKANHLHDKTIDLEQIYVNVVSKAIQVLYERGFPRIFYVVKRALKAQMNLKRTSADNELLDAHQYLDWCSHHLNTKHILSRTFVEHRKFYKAVRNVDSHVAGPKWLPESSAVYLRDREEESTVDVTIFSKRYRFLMYFCEIGSRGILGIFCDCEKGSISNSVKDRYMKMYDNPELQARLCDYPVKS